MNRMEETWKLVVNIATFGLYNNDFPFFKKSRKKPVNMAYSTPDAVDLRSRETYRKKEVSLRCPE